MAQLISLVRIGRRDVYRCPAEKAKKLLSCESPRWELAFPPTNPPETAKPSKIATPTPEAPTNDLHVQGTTTTKKS